MSLKTQLTDDMKTAMKAGDKVRLGVIRLINAAIKQREVDERIELDDAAVLAVLEKMVKQRRDSISQFDAAGRDDLAGIERDEMAIIEHYLPARLGEAEIIDAIDAAIASTGASGPAGWPIKGARPAAAANRTAPTPRMASSATFRQSDSTSRTLRHGRGGSVSVTLIGFPPPAGFRC
mgnify:CR=1 FL=1